jgi:hypothetical protein
MSTMENTSLVRRVVEEVWNLGNLEAADALFSPAYVNHGGLILDVVHGPEAIKMSVVMYRRAFPDFWVTLDDLQAEGDTVLVRWTAYTNTRSQRRDDALNVVPRSLPGATSCRFADGAIAETWIWWDRAGVLRRLGLRTAQG